MCGMVEGRETDLAVAHEEVGDLFEDWGVPVFHVCARGDGEFGEVEFGPGGRRGRGGEGYVGCANCVGLGRLGGLCGLAGGDGGGVFWWGVF